MDCVIEIKSFYPRLAEFAAGKGQLIRNVEIRRYFECLEIAFQSGADDAPVPGVGDVLPRVGPDGLRFETNVNVAGEGNAAQEKALSACFAEFFMQESGKGNVAGFLERLAAQKTPGKPSEGVKALFFIELPDTLFLRLSA